jgi:hypothetical protein
MSKLKQTNTEQQQKNHNYELQLKESNKEIDAVERASRK